MILETIKYRTQESHNNLEQSNLLRPILNKNISSGEYIEILRKFYGFFYPLETLLEKHSDLLQFLPDYNERKKSSLLLNDLDHFNASASVKVCESLPSMESLSKAFGCMYVMEGSTLGGRVITKVLQETLSIDATTGASFFNGYGTETGAKWKAFQSALVSYSTTSGEEEKIISAAEETFVKFYKWVQSI